MIDTRLGRGRRRARRACSASTSPGECSKRASAQRFAHPSSWRSTKPAGRPRSPRSQAVQLGHGVDERQAHAPADVGMPLHPRGDFRAHHLAPPALHHEEVASQDGRVVAEQVGARGAVEVAPEA
jgi:hypothetical protein